MKDLLRTADLAPADLTWLLDTADEFARHPFSQADLLRNNTVVCYFAKPSTRTRISMETAVARLGGTPISVAPQELQLGRGETIEDTARVLSRYARAIVIRTFADDDVARLAQAATIPVVNALTDGHHPCQSLADLQTIRSRFGRLRGVKVAYVGDGNNVAHSLMEAGALAGMDVFVATPPGYEPAIEVVQRARAIAAVTGATVATTYDPGHAVDHADVVYTDVWVSMGDDESERMARTVALHPFRVTPELMAQANPDAIFMHCLPAHRGEEVSAEVIDGPASWVFTQAENRLHTAQAVLVGLVNGVLAGQGTSTSVEAVAALRR